MDGSAAQLAVAKIKRIQAAFQVLLVLHLTAIHFPDQATVSDEDSFTYIIVGGGTAGCVIANRLSEYSQFNVLLIEAGGDPPLESMFPGLSGLLLDTQSDWNYTEQYDCNRKQYQNDYALPLTQGKMLGGSSANNYMSYVRGHPHDYNSWAKKLKDPCWRYENVLSYFKKSENLKDPGILASKTGKFHGTAGYLHIARSMYPETEDYACMFSELGHNIRIDINGNETLGFGECTFAIYKQTRESTAYSFLKPVKHRKNLHVLKNTFVTKILFDDFKNAIGVEALTQDRKLIKILADKEVIVTAGVFNSPKLLMLSGIGPKEDLRRLGIRAIADLPVGQNFKEQPAGIVAYKFKKLTKPFVKKPDCGKYPFPALVGFIALNKTQSYPDTESICLIFSGDSSKALETCSFSFGLSYQTCQAIYEASKEREILLCIQILLHPKSSGTIRLKSRKPEDSPIISLKSYSEEDDLEIMVDSYREVDRIRNSSYYKSVGGEPLDLKLPKCAGLQYGSREYWRCQTFGTRWSVWHFVGSCGMGRVVDPRLRVYGVGRLRVADSSSLPDLPSSNIMAPVIMVAEKAADMIKEDNYVKPPLKEHTHTLKASNPLLKPLKVSSSGSNSLLLLDLSHLPNIYYKKDNAQ
ncbi:ecdysone oxidase-like isoform X1 [Leguminivora glycinivorella]|uniref:ecdysone oxidase-like isoform X1 n=1 Tax=Leguminivora glycinivorella TaxID=1035111 RepID=UPI00200BBE6E|nr:ecdysone oxidase-like isoform X1 [Leguminivora glycinivorella]XP_047995650.1 ecdysone oxidase-like isoform X1 [Leguminivora glycinivorella]